MYANKKDTNHKTLSDIVIRIGFSVKDCSTSKDGSQDADWYSAYNNKVIHVEYKTKTGKLTDKQKEFREKNPFYKIETCRNEADICEILKKYGWVGADFKL